MSKKLSQQDKQVSKILAGELKRQQEGLELIASENYVSQAVLEVLGSVFTNKYAEGVPGKRYYGGQEFTDAIENLAVARTKKLFNADSYHINVQPLSGAPANLIVYSAILKPGDTILGMDLSHGGHLTHGHPATFSAKIYRFIGYKMKDIETGEIDYDALRELALKEKPKIILAGFSAYPRELDYKKIKEIADEVGAITMMDMAHIAGLVAGKVIKNPIDFGFDVITTTTHKTLRGPRGGMIICKQQFAAAIDKAVFPGFQGGPHMNNIAALSVALGEALKPDFKKYARQVLINAKAMADEFLKANCRLIAGGTDNHLILLDAVKSFNLSGGEAEKILEKINITVNKNIIPNDTRTPLDPSGIRLGTPAMTTRGLKEKEAREVAKIIIEVLKNHNDKKLIKKSKTAIMRLCKNYPIY